MDGDGDMDIVIGNFAVSNQLLINNGSAVFNVIPLPGSAVNTWIVAISVLVSLVFNVERVMTHTKFAAFTHYLLSHSSPLPRLVLGISPSVVYQLTLLPPVTRDLP